MSSTKKTFQDPRELAQDHALCQDETVEKAGVAPGENFWNDVFVFWNQEDLYIVDLQFSIAMVDY